LRLASGWAPPNDPRISGASDEAMV